MHRRDAVAGLLATAWAGAAWSDLVGLIAAAKSSVVAVGTSNPLDSPRFTFKGTGFLVGDGTWVATCWHVVPGGPPSAGTAAGTPSIQVTHADGSVSVREAEIIATDRLHDLSLLRLASPPGPALRLAESAVVREGTEVALIGFPIGGALGFRHVTHRGIVASIVSSVLPMANARQLTDAAVARLREGSFELLQLDATAYPGNSGGPLLEVATGQVIGVVNMVLLKGNRESALSQPTGITYAVPITHLAQLMRR